MKMSVQSLKGIFPVFKPPGITSSQFLEVIKTQLKNGMERIPYFMFLKVTSSR